MAALAGVPEVPAPKPKTVRELLAACSWLSTGCTVLDKALGGGICAHYTTEVRLP